MKLHYKSRISSERGAVSLFVVIFASLLITTITISFMQLMVRDQEQAMLGDLSASAYDSAVAGVEDAKRALLMQEDCAGNSSPSCNAIRSAIDSGECTTLSSILGGSAEETPIIRTQGDRKLEQAYTCVKITENTADYIGSMESTSSATLIPLRARAQFDKIIISWGLNKNGGAINLSSNSVKLPPSGTENWPANRPALLRAQLINGGSSFRLSDFNDTGYSNSLFLYPSSEGTNIAEFALDGRRGAIPGEPQPVRCNANTPSGAYACQMTIDVNPSISANSQTAFLNLVAFYASTDFKIELRSGSIPVLFDGVQPEVDSTGRANDLFRRVVSRVELNNTFNYPVAALETRYSICKSFSVTGEESGYSASQTCTPTE